MEQLQNIHNDTLLWLQSVFSHSVLGHDIYPLFLDNKVPIVIGVRHKPSKEKET